MRILEWLQYKLVKLLLRGRPIIMNWTFRIEQDTTPVVNFVENSNGIFCYNNFLVEAQTKEAGSQGLPSTTEDDGGDE